MHYNVKYMAKNKDALTDLLEDLNNHESDGNSSHDSDNSQLNDDQVRDENGRVINLNIEK